MPSPQEQLELLVQHLIDSKTKIEKLLSHPDHATLKLICTNQIDQLITRFAHIAGVSIAAGPQTTFKPITEFMGEKINFPKKVDVDALSPGQAQKEIFLARRDKLLLEWTTITPEGIVNSFSTGEDQLVVRSVAKFLNVPEFETKPITLKFINEITRAIEQKAKNGKIDDNVEKELAKQDEILKLEAAQRNGDELVKLLIDEVSEAKIAAGKAKPANKKAADDTVTAKEKELEEAKTTLQTVTDKLNSLKAQ